MADILIRGMEMPIACAPCKIREMCGLWRRVTLPAHIRHPDCPILELPPHGDLVDRDDVISHSCKDEYGDPSGYVPDDYACGHDDYKEWIKDLPIIISADKEIKP